MPDQSITPIPQPRPWRIHFENITVFASAFVMGVVLVFYLGA